LADILNAPADGKEPWWRKLARNAFFNVLARLIMFATFGLLSVIATWELGQAQTLAAVDTRTTTLEARVEPLAISVSAISDSANKTAGRMDRMETRADFAKDARDKNQDQTIALLTKNADIQSGMLQQLAALNAHLSDIDKRLDRLENSRGTQ
jgi:hypothetical protein